MSIREQLIQEIERQPEPVLRELQQYFSHLIHLQNLPSESDWPPGYFQSTAGAFADEPFERPSQLPMETRQNW